jgi:hypothetical protein
VNASHFLSVCGTNDRRRKKADPTEMGREEFIKYFRKKLRMTEERFNRLLFVRGDKASVNVG